jgi:hypothetical protein
MSQRAASALALWLLTLWSPAALAWDFSIKGHELTLDITNTAGYTYHFNNDPIEYADPNDPKRLDGLRDDTFHQIFNKLDISLSYGAYRAGARLDLNLFANTPFDQHCGGANQPAWCTFETPRYRNQFDAERLFVVVTRPEFDLTLGDFYASFGKGLALSVIQQDDIGQDTTIRGGKLAIHYEDLGLTLLAGTTNVLNIDKATGYDAPWDPEPILAARLEYRFFETVIAGAHAVYVIREEPNRGQSGYQFMRSLMHETLWGFGAEAPDLLGGALSVGGEVDFQRTRDFYKGLVRGPGADGGLSGFAAYFSSTLNVADLTVLAELKYYDDFQLVGLDKYSDSPYVLVYHLPPTLDRKKALIKEGNTHVKGGRIRLDYNVGQLGPLELLLYANYGYFHNWAPEVNPFAPPTDGDKRAHSPFGGFELDWAENTGQLKAEGGMRRVFDHVADEIYQKDVHVEVSVEQAFGKHGVGAKVLFLDRTSKVAQLNEWHEIEAALSYTWSSKLAISVTYERQEDPAQVPQPVDLFGGIVRYYIKSDTYVNLRVGENRGGIKCLNGACTFVPPFSGVEALFVMRY